jgi:ribosomal protein S14
LQVTENEKSKTFFKFYLQLNKKNLLKQTNKVCFYTSRKKGIYTFFNLSRQTIKEYASNELLPGILKGSW